MFAYCTSLTEIGIPETVTNIEIAAFSDCTALESVIIPEAVTEIGKEAFYNCPLLTVYAPHPSDYYGYEYESIKDWVIR